MAQLPPRPDYPKPTLAFMESLGKRAAVRYLTKLYRQAEKDHPGTIWEWRFYPKTKHYELEGYD